MKPPPYRTAGTLILFGLMIGALVWLCPSESRGAVAQTAIPALSSLGLWAAGKSAWEHHVNAKAAAEPPK